VEKIALLALALLALPVQAAGPEDAFKQGNEAYLAGRYADAVTAYESARSQGLRHWILAYNLGDAYYRAGQLGKSVVNFERAFRLNPGNADVIDNVALATAKAGDPRLPQSALPRLGWRIFYWPGLNAMTVIGMLCFWTLAAALIAQFLGRRFMPAVVTRALAGVVLILGSWIAIRIYLRERPLAVVITSVAEVRSGPNLSYPANFTVPEGRRVLLLDEVEPVSDWVEIGVPQEGLKGWVPDTAVEKV
jgi:tetratricopeptide (TPR) repeat protein